MFLVSRLSYDTFHFMFLVSRLFFGGENLAQLNEVVLKVQLV